MRLSLSDVVPCPEVGQHWVHLNPMKLFRIDKLNFLGTDPDGTSSGSLFSVEGKTWSPHGVQDEVWVLPMRSEDVRLLWFTSLMKINHFGGYTPNCGSVWAFNNGEMFFVGQRSTQTPDCVWVFTDHEFVLDDNVEALWIDMREIQRGPEPLEPERPPLPEDATALEQLLEDD